MYNLEAVQWQCFVEVWNDAECLMAQAHFAAFTVAVVVVLSLS